MLREWRNSQKDIYSITYFLYSSKASIYLYEKEEENQQEHDKNKIQYKGYSGTVGKGKCE